MKKYTVIIGICFVLMIAGIILLYSPSISTMIGNWVFNDPNRGNYTQTQTNVFSTFMIILILGTPIILLAVSLIVRILRKRELNRLERDGKTEEYREKADKYGF